LPKSNNSPPAKRSDSDENPRRQRRVCPYRPLPDAAGIHSLIHDRDTSPREFLIATGLCLAAGCQCGGEGRQGALH
jgi:hypothetical protein